MKIAPYALVASAVVLSTTASAIPAFFKRAGDQAAAFACLFNYFTGQGLSDACSMTIATDFGIVTSGSLSDLTIDLTSSADPPSFKWSSTGLTLGLLSIPGVSYQVTEAKSRNILNDNSIDIARFETPSASATQSGASMTTTVGQSPLIVYTDKQAQFSAFVGALITKPSHTFSLKSSGDVTVLVTIPVSYTLPFGMPSTSIKLNGVGCSASYTMAGVNLNINNSNGLQFKSLSSHTVDPITGAFSLTLTIILKNPSQLYLNLGDLMLDTVDGTGVAVGTTLLQAVNLVPGDNTITAIVTSSAAASATLYKKVTTMGDTWTLTGAAGTGSKNTVVAAALVSLKAMITIPALNVN
ncbi:hypothetical protein BGZ90_006747 [Linnemannia elongata]|nr:hypothetical protein BGZ90_006747 [Linnemannia elongata]